MALLQTDYDRRPYPALLPGQLILAHFAAAFFSLTLFTDWAYVRTAIVMWQDFSEWLLFAGLVVGAFAVILWLIGWAVLRRRPVWPVAGLNILVLATALLNSLIHGTDGWTAVVPWGIGLSVVTCLLMLLSAFLWRNALYRTFRR